MRTAVKNLLLPTFSALMSIAAFSPSYAASGHHPPINPVLGVWDAPVGHRQPSTVDVPAAVLKSAGTITDREQQLDKRLNICRGC